MRARYDLSWVPQAVDSRTLPSLPWSASHRVTGYCPTLAQSLEFPSYSVLLINTTAILTIKKQGWQCRQIICLQLILAHTGCSHFLLSSLRNRETCCRDLGGHWIGPSVHSCTGAGCVWNRQHDFHILLKILAKRFRISLSDVHCINVWALSYVQHRRTMYNLYFALFYPWWWQVAGHKLKFIPRMCLKPLALLGNQGLSVSFLSIGRCAGTLPLASGRFGSCPGSQGKENPGVCSPSSCTPPCVLLGKHAETCLDFAWSQSSGALLALSITGRMLHYLCQLALSTGAWGAQQPIGQPGRLGILHQSP